MAKIVYTDIPSLIENAHMQVRTSDGVATNYTITPNSGYVLHDKNYDDPVLDEQGNETGEFIPCYRTSTASVGADYDFTVNEREFYTVLRNAVPEDQIFGSIGSKPEIA